MAFLKNSLAARLAGLMAAFVLAVLAVLSTLFFAPAPAQALGESPGGTTIVARTGVLYPATSISTATYTASPRTVSGVDLSNTAPYFHGDYFVTADFPTTGTLTATLEYSIDGTNWATALHRYNNGATLVTASQQVIITGDGTAYISAPVAGTKARLKLEPSTAVTTTVNVALKNTGGN